MAGKSFYEVLEAQVRSDLRKEIEAELRAEMMGGTAESARQTAKQSGQGTAAAPGIFETWLAANTGKTFFSQTSKAKQAYNSRSQPKSSKLDETMASTASEPLEGRADVAGSKSDATASRDVATASATTLEEICALELLRRQSGSSIGETYTEAELKAAWRRAALKCHPDRFAQDDSLTQSRMSALFAEVCSAYERLASAFETAKAAC